MAGLLADIDAVPVCRRWGAVRAVEGLMVEIAGLTGAVAVGSRVHVGRPGALGLDCEIVGFREDRALALPFGGFEGVALGARAEVMPDAPGIRPSKAWLGRVVDALGRPVDGRGALAEGPGLRDFRARPPAAHARKRVGPKIDLGVRSLNAFTSICRGQRMGIFSASGVGKSTMLSMLARYTQCDVAVIGLIGERGRELQEFIEDDLGPEGLARSVVVVATSDEPALMRRQAAWAALALAEHFRDQGLHVLCMLDSITRFAMAQREIGLAAGEPPTAKGYPPTVFAELPRLLERAGPGPRGAGDITGLFTVLVEGDDHDEPIADAVRGILDGHVVLERSIAERGRYPAVNVLRSISRTMPGCNEESENALVAEARRYLAAYEDMAELIRIGAYKQGADPELDRAIRLYPRLEAFLGQDKAAPATLAETYAGLDAILAEERQ